MRGGWVSLSLLIWLAQGFLFAQEPQRIRAILLQVRDRQAELNRGSAHGVRVGMRFVVEREGERRGLLQVNQVGEFRSWATILEQRGLVVGDVAFSEEAVVAPSLAPAKPKAIEGPPPKAPVAFPRPPWGYRTLDVVSAEDFSYDALRSLAAQGLLPGYSVRDFWGEQQRLWTRKELGQLLAQAVQRYRASPVAWDEGARATLARLLREFRYEVLRAGVAVEEAIEKLEERGWGQRPSSEFHVSLAGEAAGGAASRLASSGELWGRGSLLWRLGGGTEAFLTAHRSREDPTLLLRERRKVEQAGLHWRGAWGTDWTLGRAFLRWGPGYYGAMLLSENAPALDLVRFQGRARILKIPFEFDQFHATFSDRGARRYVAGRRLSFLLGNRTEVGLAETLMIQETVHLLLSPFISPLLLLETQIVSPERTSNLFGSVDLALHIDESSSAYFQWLLDDMTTLHPPVRRKVGFLLGGHWKDRPLNERWDMRLEYVYIDPNVYGHRQPLASWEVQGRVLGHRIGGGAEDLFLRLRYSPTPRDDVTLILNALRKAIKEASPMKDVQGSLSYHRDLSPRLFVGVRWLERRVRNLGAVAGVDRDERRLWLETGYGF